MVDQLLEKYLTGFKNTSMRGNGEVWDIFVNPTKKEMKEFKGMFRFIADSARDNLYIFDADLGHDAVWSYHIKPKIKDARNVYWDEHLFAGAVEGGRVFNWGITDIYYTEEVLESWLDDPDMFRFTKKYGLDVEGYIKKNEQRIMDILRNEYD